MRNLQSIYSKILDLLHDIESEDIFLNQIRLPMIMDKELMALNLAAESPGIDSEHFLFKQLPDEVKGRIERPVYSRRIGRLSLRNSGRKWRNK